MRVRGRASTRCGRSSVAALVTVVCAAAAGGLCTVGTPISGPLRSGAFACRSSCTRLRCRKCLEIGPIERM
eukprot:32618-Prymnesium_polylepis.2